MDIIHKYNPDAFYGPKWGTYLQLMNAKDIYIQNITVSEHDNHSNSFQVNFPKVFTNYTNGPTRVRNKKYIDWSSIEHGGTRKLFHIYIH